MTVAACRCGKTKRFRGHRHRWTCPECRASKVPKGVDVACAGCGRTQRVRESKARSCEGYLCGFGGCNLAPDFRIPPPPAGHVRVIEYHAAGGFSGWRSRPETDEDRDSLARARAIRDAALRRLGVET